MVSRQSSAVLTTTMSEIPSAGRIDEQVPQYQHLIRPGRSFFKSVPNRRISCKDLGHGDCEGWLWKKRIEEGKFRRDWKKYWFKLLAGHLYVFNHPDDQRAKEKFGLSGFLIMPNIKDSSKRFAFTVFHKNIGTFYFASERQEDMAKWMNKLQLASINVNPNGTNRGSYSGSENEDDDNSVCSPNHISTSPLSTVHSITETISNCDSSEDAHIPHVLDLNVHCSSFKRLSDFRMSVKRANTEASLSRQEQLTRRLAVLQRTLKDKTHVLKDIDGILNMSPMTSLSLQTFIKTHPEVIPDHEEDPEQDDMTSPETEEKADDKELQHVVANMECISSPITSSTFIKTYPELMPDHEEDPEHHDLTSPGLEEPADDNELQDLIECETIAMVETKF